MAKINSSAIYETIKKLCILANCRLPKEEYFALTECYKNENNEQAKTVLTQILENAKIAFIDQRPLCQDTGFVTLFAEIGQNVQIYGDDFNSTVNKAVSDAYTEYFYRKSLVTSPINERENTNNNTPVLIHTQITPGDTINLILSIKGGGCENVSSLKMLTPTEGECGIIDFVLETIKQAGSKPCPPIRVGIGIGSNFEGSAILSKKALLEPLSNPSDLEKQLLEKINALNIGAMGFSGNSTCFGVNILDESCHIASLPVAISIACHSSRHSSAKITEDKIIFEENNYDFSKIQNKEKKLRTINTTEITEIKNLRAGEAVAITGKIYTARDAAHKKLEELITKNKDLPIDIKNAIIFYAGPCPANKNEIIGPIGPTTSARMDKFTPKLYEMGLLATIGKGERNQAVKLAAEKYNGKYFTVTGGVASLLKKSIKSAKIVAYPELGAEALYELEVENFPVMVNF